MKSLKITVLAIFSIVLLTGVNALNTESSQEEINKEVKGVKIDLITMNGKKGLKPPTNG